MSIGAPTTAQRATILESLLANTPVTDSGGPDAPGAAGGGLLALVATRTPGFVAADLRLLCQESVMLAVKKIDADSPDAGPDSVLLGLSHFDKALVRLLPLAGLYRLPPIQFQSAWHHDRGGRATVRGGGTAP